LLQYVILGGGFAFAAAAQPGPFQTFLLSKVVQHGWRKTLPAALAPLITDGPIALLILLVLHSVPSGLTRALQFAGGIVLIVLAVLTYRSWRWPPDETEHEGSAPHTLLQAATVNFLNPGPYLGWSLVLGPAVLREWSAHP
jgi:threonine/homoserine/homoserine lactone efflux protein